MIVAITGAARGIGYALATEYSRAGARVAIGDIDNDRVEEAADGIRGALGLNLDVTDETSFENFIDVTEERLGPIDILVNNAGIMPVGPFLSQNRELAERVMGINVHGPLTGMQLILPRMLGRGGGRIVNIASTAGKASGPGCALYSASKAALILMSDGVRQEFAGHGIRITTVLPSFTNTELIAGTKGVRGVKTLQPGDVARAIVRGVDRNRPTIVLPASANLTIRMQELLPVRLKDALMRITGADRVFVDIDASARSAYDERIGSEGGRAAADACSDVGQPKEN
jgi:NAD(P)-dependent dehydrogenase (short-subunit alcohol dehydrogenase family)